MEDGSESDYQPLSMPTFSREARAGEVDDPWDSIIRGFNSALVWAGARQPIAADIKRQLVARPRPPDSVWGDAPERIRIARIVCRAAKDAMWWPNDHFIPDDRVNVAFYEHVDGLDTGFLVLEIEKRLSIRVSDEEAIAWFDGTLGDVVDWLMNRVATTRFAP
jgi:acyl carrier protein